VLLRFETLIDLYHDEIYGYLWRLLDDAGRINSIIDAQDLTQEVFLRAYRGFERLRPDSNHRAWLYKIATNCAHTAMKSGSRRARLSAGSLDKAREVPADEGLSPYHQVVRDEELTILRRAISALPPKQEAALMLRYVQGLGYPEIAQALGCSEESARANVYQAARRLRREVGE
jgi:RNA polymerase sigma-70 factor (ECF subfamily)